MRRQRDAALFMAFAELQGIIKKETETIDSLLSQNRYSIDNVQAQMDIQNLPLVRMMAQFEEYSEYENIFTNNQKAVQ